WLIKEGGRLGGGMGEGFEWGCRVEGCGDRSESELGSGIGESVIEVVGDEGVVGIGSGGGGGGVVGVEGVEGEGYGGKRMEVCWMGGV
ncbi:hypothetical protein, partial [Paenibacillus xylanexedens]|uniref:hypothetical protein n=1 Tax=Paenibacillus xylanexedens TaxID=528191 RepID=UPI001C9318A8